MSRSTRNRKPSNTDIDTTVEVDTTNTVQEDTMQENTTTESVDTLAESAEAFVESVVNPPAEEEQAKLLTPFEAARRVNDALAERQIIDPKTAKVKKIPGQMMYNYTTARLRNGEKPLIKAAVNAAGKTILDEDDFTAWLGRYLEKLTPKAAPAEESEVSES